MPERIPEILNTLGTLQGSVDSLIEEIGDLKDRVDVSEEVSTKADKASRRAWHLTLFDLFLTVVAFALGGLLTLALIHANDAQTQSRKNAVTQYEACVNGNHSRADIEGYLGGLLNSVLVQLQTGEKTAPAAQRPLYQQQVVFYQHQIDTLHQTFAPRTCPQAPK